MGWREKENGLALVSVLLVMLVLMAIGAFVILAVNRSTETRVAYQNQVAGFYAAEAGVNRGAGRVRNIFLGFNVPTGADCDPHEFTINERTVRYQLTGCGQSPTTRTLPTGDPFEGLNAIVYTYDLRSEARNQLGYSEAVVRLRFESRLIPMFQFAAFYKEDLELTVGPPMVIGGRMHTNKDMYLNTESCDPGLQIQGQLTLVGELYRGRKDTLNYQNSGRVWIRKRDGNLLILGRMGPGDTSCGAITTRRVPEEEAALWEGRIAKVRDVRLPGQNDLVCAPWSCPPGTQPGSYWRHADLRIVLNTTRREKLDPDNPNARGPQLYALEVYNADGTVDGARTTLLRRFARDVPGGITYSDVPRNGQCVEGQSCETNYDGFDDYDIQFPRRGVNGCDRDRGPRDEITAQNFCNDFRYGGFYNWRERKPVLLLNIDWIKLEEWNLRQPAGARLFDPNDTSEGGLVVYATVRGPRSGDVNNYGVRLYNAQRLRFGREDRGATFVSDQAVYIMGNFNCAAPRVIGDAQPAQCGAYGKKPAAVVGDTVNVLSCAWAGGACRSSLSNGVDESGPAYRPRDERSTNARSRGSDSRPAEETFVNAAFLGGNDITTCPGNPGGRDCLRDYYSGGLENYPRFHENWRGVRLWYEGSLVAIDAPKRTCFTYNAGLGGTDDPAYSCRTYQWNGKWLQGYWRMQELYGYVPPQRRWFYDVSFNDGANLPPLSPRFVSLKLRWFTEEFR